MTDLPEALADRTAFLLRLALNRAEAMGEQAIEPLGLTGRQYGVLAMLQNGPATTQRQLGLTLGFDRTTTMKLMAASRPADWSTASPIRPTVAPTA